MGPIIVQAGRRASGLVFELHPLSRAMIQSALSKRERKGRVEELAREVVPTLTGLKLDDLEKLGYALIEDDTDRTLVYVRPGELVQA